MPEYPGRLHHSIPHWVKNGAGFHIRIRMAEDKTVSLADPVLGRTLLASAQYYHQMGRWWCDLILLMPDHLHALLAIPDGPGLAKVVRDWKRVTARMHHVNWQNNFFDHRLRNSREGNEKWHYIRRNPVVKGLCAAENDWPYWWSGAQNQGGAACKPPDAGLGGVK